MKKEGQQIRQYTLIRRLGRGGMGEVWLAETYGPLQYKKKFCIKTLLPEMREHLDYFATEARLGGWLTHANLVNVIDFFEERGEFYIVQEYVEGLNFAELLAHDLVKQWYGRFPIEMAAFIIWSVLKGLYYAHTAAFGGPSRRGKLVHRDISTDNILLSGDAEAKLGDFGIAQVEEEWRKRTQGPNAFRGKPMNVSPEYLMALELDARADLYQMALVLYEAVTGVHPFAAASSSAFSVMVAVREGRIQPTCQIAPWVDPALGALIDGLLQVDRDKRTPSDADTFRNRLYEVCPRLIAAERPLAELIRDATTRQRRLTSPLIRPEDMPHIKVEAPPMRDGVVLTATAEEPTAPLRMEHLAPMAVGGGASAAEHPARGGKYARR